MTLHRLLMASALIQGIGLIFTTLLGILLARTLGPTNYGIYGLVMAVVSLAAVVAQFGLPTLATREAARPDVNLRKLTVWTAQRASAIACGTVAVSSAALLLWSPPWLENRWGLLLLGGSFTVVSALLACIVAIVRGAGSNIAGQVVDLLARPVIVTLALFLLSRLTILSVPLALGAQIATVVLCLLATFWLLQRLFRGSGSSDAPFLSAPWMGVASTFMANSLLGVSNASYPMIIAGFLVSGPDLGVLRVALASSTLLALPSTIANIATIPLVAREHASNDREALARTLSHTTLATFALTGAGWLALILFGRPAVEILFGSEYGDAVYPLLILGLGQLVIAAFGISGSYLNLTSREGLVTRAFLIAVPLGMIASVVLTFEFGISGAAAGTVVMAIAWHLYVFGVRRREIDAPLSLFAAISRVGAGKR